MMRKIIWILGILVIVVGIAWMNRIDILLKVLQVKTSMNSPISPNREVVWEKGPMTASESPSQRKPNIIIILADDLGFNDISFYARDKSKATLHTPHIDALAGQGVSFANAYASSPTCAPSRAAIMTGRYPTRFGYEFMALPDGMGKMIDLVSRQNTDRLRYPIVHQEAMDNIMAFDDMGMPTQEITIAEVLKASGYHTVHIGKWHLGRKGPLRPEAQGFNESLTWTVCSIFLRITPMLSMPNLTLTLSIDSSGE